MTHTHTHTHVSLRIFLTLHNNSYIPWILHTCCTPLNQNRMNDISVIVFDDYDPTSSWHRCVGRHSDLGRLVLPSQQQSSDSFFRHDLTCASKVTLGYTFKYVYFFSKWHAQYKGLHLSITPHELNAHSTIKHSTLLRRLQNYYEITIIHSPPPMAQKPRSSSSSRLHNHRHTTPV